MKHLARAAVLAVAITALLASATSASAATRPGYEIFSNCPDRSVDPAITVCFTTRVTSGHLQMGDTNTPITDPIELDGALKPSPTVGGIVIVGHFDGGRQQVPGGIIGITELDWLINLFPGDLLKLYAEPELAGEVLGGPFAETLTLPMRVKLDNPLLSNNCYIGSVANPVTLNLTVGTTNPPPPNTPISGQAGDAGPHPVLPGVIQVTNETRVDNAFAAPAASGCGFLGLGLIDALVNSVAGLPSPAGTNETIQNGEGEISPVFVVYPPAGIEL
jgi:hypothetical protein